MLFFFFRATSSFWVICGVSCASHLFLPCMRYQFLLRDPLSSDPENLWTPLDQCTYTTLIHRTQVNSTAVFHDARPPPGLEDPYTTFVPTEVGVKDDSNEFAPFSSHLTMTMVSYFSVHLVTCACLSVGKQ